MLPRQASAAERRAAEAARREEAHHDAMVRRDEQELQRVSAEVGRLRAERAALLAAAQPEPEPEPRPAATGTEALAAPLPPEHDAATKGTEGTMAPLLECGWAVPRRRSATICSSELRAAQLRLLLGFLHSDRLAEHCALVLEAGRVTETIAACFRVRTAVSLVRGFWLDL